jgi:hypothetical protein
LPDETAPGPPHHSGICTADNFTASIIIKIAQWMIDHGDSGGDYRILELELESLYRTLILTSLAIQTYEHTPLGQHLAHSIVPEVEQVCVVLQQLFDKLKDYQQGLMSTSIRALWYRIRQNCCEADEGLTSLRAKLAASQKLLGQFLIALNS